MATPLSRSAIGDGAPHVQNGELVVREIHLHVYTCFLCTSCPPTMHNTDDDDNGFQSSMYSITIPINGDGNGE